MFEVIKQICVEYESDSRIIYKTYLSAKLFQKYVYVCFLQLGNTMTGSRDPIQIRDFKECDTEERAIQYLEDYYKRENT